MKKTVCAVLVLALAVPFVFSGGAREPRGKLVIYTSMYEDVIEALKKDLGRQFPKCAVEFVYGGTGALQARVEAERASGRLGCDILLVAEPSYSLELKEKGVLHSYASPQAAGLAFEYDAEGFWYPVRISNMVLAYNPERNAKTAVPNSFRDFAYDTGARGAVSMSNPLISGTAMAAVAALGAKYEDYFEALGRQNVMIDSGAVALQKLESGEAKAAMILEELVLKKRQEEGSALEVIYPEDGAVVIPSTIMIISRQWSAGKNTQAAELVTDWFLSPQGQDAIVDAWMHSVRAGFPRLPYDAKPTGEIMAGSIPVNWENYKTWEETLARFEESVTHSRGPQ